MSNTSIRSWNGWIGSGAIKAFALVLPMLWAAPARADLYSASQAYEKKDYVTAFREFKELAEMGQPTAQFDLAVLYATGRGVMQNFTLAQSWASIAAANGVAPAKQLVAALTPRLTPNSLLLSSQMQAEYSPSALAAKLFPHLLQHRDYAGLLPVKRLKAYVPGYPLDAQQRGIQGVVFVQFLVAPDGRARMPRILYALPTGYFESTVLESVMRSSFLPALRDGLPVAVEIGTLYQFTMNHTSIADYGDLESRVRDTEKKAAAGDVGAQMLYGMMIAGLPQLHETYDQALPWFLKAAQAGEPYAQFQLGIALLRGRGCDCDTAKAEIWLEKAAEAGEADAQISLADYLLDTPQMPQAPQASQAPRTAAAIGWLDRAARSGNRFADLRLAAVIASNADPALRDPARALRLADHAARDYDDDPSLWEIRAAAEAQSGAFTAAQKDERHAIRIATRLKWDLAAPDQRQADYAAGKAWTGDVLRF